MTTTNSNGAKRNGKAKTAITEPATTTDQLEQLEQMLAEEPKETPQETAQAPEPTSEQLLQQAKQETRAAKPQEEEKPDPTPTTGGGEITTATSQIEGAIAQSAQKLVQIEEQARTARVQMGFELGQQEAQDIRQGHQLGLLTALVQAKAQDTNDLAEQLQALRQHTDGTTSTAINSLLQGLVKEPAKIAPLGQATPTQRKLKII
ncbi:hypothetical protein G7B40_001510 [Aetokthonos hydrillicola Thurmond2011]|jgi:predicted RecA/RadA family phage recombinase|uniref:Uncharacterized protein n=1 Tax=Aetokthonos hydrillicola Thurmond2011 TaxID=2712845 RepID=A0AAP5I548_9CYAN|nr:hypothetical protein [Aetokthonos hydrillicola]MBO3464139.1 hypothetical protein [Aetokthonos hydrillicola CCALA 1050]MBW4591075.1 hypothetical protein [Aetokthonos hydrillicola CCALA 1050]MDR9893263.1 hypothetical protein [Aetokthonos hydrillicola Thurmond2011]